MKLYDHKMAPNTRRVRVFLAEKGIEVPTQPVDLQVREQHSEPFVAMNPFASVPVLELAGLTLVQTDKVRRPLPIILYGREFWNRVLDLQALSDWGTISPKDLELFKVCDSVDEAFETLTLELLRLYPALETDTYDPDPDA